MSNENNNQLTNKNKEAQYEIKELKAKLKGKISLIEVRQLIQDNIIQEIQSIQQYIHIISRKNVMIKRTELVNYKSKEDIQKELSKARKMIKY